MIIDLTKEEWEFLQRICIRTVAFAEMNDDTFQAIPKDDHRKAKALLVKFITGSINQ